MNTLFQDLKFGLRMLAKNPGFTAVAVLTLALGIAANTAMFSLVESVLFQRVPAKDSSQLAMIYTSGPHGAGYSATSYPDYRYYRDHTHVFSGVMAYARIRVSWTHGDETDFPWAEVVSENYFRVLGVKLFMGRAFLPHEDTVAGTSQMAVVSYEFWQNQLSSDMQVLGKALVLGGNSFTVIGVAPRGFKGINLDWGSEAQIWVPMATQSQVLPTRIDFLEARDVRWLMVMGRLKPGVRRDEAKADLEVAATQLAASYPTSDKERVAILLPADKARIWPTWRESIADFLALLTIAAVLVLLIACSNVANLLLLRASERRREIATRLALGASRARVIRQLLTEDTLLAFMGAAVGLGIAMLILVWVRKFGLPFMIRIPFDPRLDARALGFTFALCFLITLLAGSVPAIEALKTDLNLVLKEGSRGASSGRYSSILRNALIISQVALALVSLVGAGLLLRNLSRVQATAPGFDPRHILIAGTNLASRKYSDADGTRLYQQLLGGLRRLPGTQSASLSWTVPLSPVHSIEHVTPDRQLDATAQEGLAVQTDIVSPGYFDTLHIPMVHGREFSVEDNPTAPKVVIINKTLAQALWPRQDPVGKHLKTVEKGTDFEVIGVASDIKYHTLWESSQSYMYLPLLQNYILEVHLEVRTIGDPLRSATVVRHEISKLDSQVPIYDIESFETRVSDALSQPRMATSLTTFFGFLALVLILVGIYGVIAKFVALRAHEIGIRMALGAQHEDVVRMVVRQGLLLYLVGVTIGLPTSFGLTHLLANWLYGISPTDAITYVTASVLLMFAVVLTSYIPARRAAKVDPMVALRYE